jgi:2-keto-4-pentenoate hydratase/2-oxohepta-3-ene-1,7-dioic acid hydratase in catechol pathway
MTRWLRYSHEGRTSYGIVEDERVNAIEGDPFDRFTRTSKWHQLSEVRIEIPVVPGTFYAAGLNYAHHIREAAAKKGVEPVFPQKPDIGYRANNALVAHDQPVILPPDVTEKVAYEGELVVVIGKKARHVSEADALSVVFGYTIGNDISERTWQKSDRTFWRAKNTDTFKPMGPWIETEVDLDGMETIVRLNGQQQLRFSTNDMIFGIRRYISTMSRYLTLHPGDVIWMGTDGSSPDIKAGDVVEIDISGIGTLRNRFEAG